MPKPKIKHGPDADALKLTGDWRDAVKKAIEKPRPADGWPVPDSLYKPRKKSAKKRKPKS